MEIHAGVPRKRWDITEPLTSRKKGSAIIIASLMVAQPAFFNGFAMRRKLR
jgi:hypothetical protein